MHINNLYKRMPLALQDGLELFKNNSGSMSGYVSKRAGIIIGSKGSGIIKSSAFSTANAILITHNDTYHDLPIVTLLNGTRILAYHEENPENKGAATRNTALKTNIELQYLVGIWNRQPKKVKGKKQYQIEIGLPVAHLYYFTS